MADRLSEFLRTRRFRPNALPTIAMLALVVLAVALGNWQRHRAMDREVQAAAFAAAVREPPVELPASVDPEALRYRAVRVRGEYVGAQQLLIDNKIHAGRAGFDVVTPLHIANSERYVLVDRGWVAQGVRRTDIPEVSAPSGSVTVVGRANIPPRRYLELGASAPASKIWQNLDIGRIAAASALPLLPFVIEQTEPAEPPDPLVRDWRAADVGAAQNWSYMFQWYSFATLAIVLWLLLNWRRVEERRGSP